MIVSKAYVATGVASKYLIQLCKHFGHKVAVDYDESRGRVDFPFGTCRLTADEAGLSIDCETPDHSTTERIRNVVSDHLERFAWREKPTVEWADSGSGE